MAASLDAGGHRTLLEKKQQQWAQERASRSEEWFPFGRPGAGAPLVTPAQRLARERASFRKTVEFLNTQGQSGKSGESSEKRENVPCSQEPSTSGINVQGQAPSQLSSTAQGNNAAASQQAPLVYPPGYPTYPYPGYPMVSYQGAYPQGGLIALPPDAGPVTIPVQHFGATLQSADSAGSLHTPDDNHAPLHLRAPSVHSGGNPSSGDQANPAPPPPPPLYMHPYYPYHIPYVGGPPSLASGSFPGYAPPPPHHMVHGGGQAPTAPSVTGSTGGLGQGGTYTEQWANQLHMWSDGHGDSEGRHPTAAKEAHSRSLGTTGYVETAPSLNSDGLGLLAPDTLHRRRNLITSGKESAEQVENEVKELERRAIIEQQIALKRAQEAADARREAHERAKIEAERMRIESRLESEDGEELNKWKKLREKEEARAAAVLESMRRAEQEAKAIRHAKLHRHASQSRSRGRSEPPDLDLLNTADAMSLSTPTEALAVPFQSSGIESADEEESEWEEQGHERDAADTAESTASVIQDTPRSRMSRSQSVPSGTPYPESPGDERPIKPMAQDPLAVWEQMVRDGAVPQPQLKRGGPGRASLQVRGPSDRSSRQNAVNPTSAARRNRSQDRNSQNSHQNPPPSAPQTSVATKKLPEPPTTKSPVPRKPATPLYKRTVSDLTGTKQPTTVLQRNKSPANRTQGRPTTALPGQRSRPQSRSRSRSSGKVTGNDPGKRPPSKSPVRPLGNQRPGSKSPGHRRASPSPHRTNGKLPGKQEMDKLNGHPKPKSKNGVERNVALRRFSPGRNNVPNEKVPTTKRNESPNRNPQKSQVYPNGALPHGAVPAPLTTKVRRRSIDKPMTAFLFPDSEQRSREQNRESRPREPRKMERPTVDRSQLLPDPVMPFEFDGRNPLFQQIQTRARKSNRLRKPGAPPPDQFDINPQKFDLLPFDPGHPPPDPEPRSESLNHEKPTKQHTWNSHIDAPGRKSYFDSTERLLNGNGTEKIGSRRASETDKERAHKWNKNGMERTYDTVADEETPYPSSGISSLRTTQDSDVLTQFTLPGQWSRRSLRRSFSRGASPQRYSREHQREVLAKLEAVRMDLKAKQKLLEEPFPRFKT